MVLGYDELISAGANALGYPDPYGGAGKGLTGTSLEIAQVDGSPDQRLAVVLRGRALPFELVDFEVTQRTKLTWYPGNPVATQQILGPEEVPTVMSGTWSNRFLARTIVVNGDEAQIRTVADAVKLFNAMARSGKQVRLQWASEIRTGIIKRFRPSWQREQDATWELEFEWTSRDEETAARGSSGLDSGVATDLLSFLNRVEDIAALVPLAADIAVSAVASVISAINRVRDIVSDVVQVLRLAETLVSVPATVLGGAKAALSSLELEVSELTRRLTGPRSSGLDAVSATQLKGDTSSPLLSKQGAALASSSDTQELKYEIWRRSVALSSENLLYATQQQVAQLARRTQPQTVQMVTIKAEQDLYSVSRQYYGAPDYANFLAQVNRLTSARVPAGTQLRIPPRPSGASANVDLVHSPRGSCDARCSC